jgi:hypothetical protein
MRFAATGIFVALAVVATMADAGAGTPPTRSSVAAATATAKDNPLCVAIEPFYWEIGDAGGSMVSHSVGTPTVAASTKMDIASAAKWLYAAYVVEERGGAANLTDDDIPFLHFTSGYSNMGNLTTGTCPAGDDPDTVNVCLARINTSDGLPFTYQNPATIGVFDYDSGHMENHASLYMGLGNVTNTALGPVIFAELGPGVSFSYSEPLLAAGVYSNASTYALFLRHILDGSLAMLDALGLYPVCTLPSPTCDAVYSPIPEAWHYSMGHWVEDDPATNGDGAFSSAGTFGFYPWIEASAAYYGVLARKSNALGEQGYTSAECGRLIRAAWDTGIKQTGSLPNP